MRRIASLLVFVLVLSGLSVATGPPASAAKKCGKAPQVKDAKGDGTSFLVLEGEVLPNEPALDIWSASITYDAKKKALTFSVLVDDLTDAPPLASEGKFYRFQFTYLAALYEIRSQSDDVVGGGAKIFELVRPGLPGESATLAALKGKFDTKRDVVSAVVPLSTFNKTAKPSKKLQVGAKLQGLDVLAQRPIGVITATTDEALASCDYFVEAVRKK